MPLALQLRENVCGYCALANTSPTIKVYYLQILISKYTLAIVYPTNDYLQNSMTLQTAKIPPAPPIPHKQLHIAIQNSQHPLRLSSKVQETREVPYIMGFRGFYLPVCLYQTGYQVVQL